MEDIVLLDGGMGQELINRSAQKPHPLWSAKVLMDEPGLVQALHTEYIAAGARVITLNSYSATPKRLARDGAPEMFKPLQARAIELAQAARVESGQEVRIAGCLPPLLASYRPHLSPDFEANLLAYREIVAEQADHVDLIICETMSSIVEGRAAALAAVETGKPVWLSFSIADDSSGTLRSGEPLKDALAAVDDIALEAVLLNCSTPEAISLAIPDLAATGRTAGAYANGFTSIDALEPGGTVDVLTTREDLRPEAYGRIAMGWIRDGARIVGGCCAIGPAHIAHLSRALSEGGYKFV